MRVEEIYESQRNAKLIIAHYVSNINDPFRNNLVTRNSKTLNEVEILIKNNLQHLKINQVQKPNISANFTNKMANS